MLNDSNEAKLCDFGLATTDQHGEYAVGSYYTMAPEVALRAKYSFEADVYSLGLVIYMIVSGNLALGRKEAVFYPPKLLVPDKSKNAAVYSEVDILISDCTLETRKYRRKADAVVRQLERALMEIRPEVDVKSSKSVLEHVPNVSVITITEAFGGVASSEMEPHTSPVRVSSGSSRGSSRNEDPAHSRSSSRIDAV